MTLREPPFAESIRTRLQQTVRARGEKSTYVLQRYAVERFLYRLGQSRIRDQFVLKGATLFTLWGAFYRATRDVDLTGYGDSRPESLEAAIREICAVPCPGDGLEFRVEGMRISAIREENSYGGFRVQMEVGLGKSRIPFQADVGYGNAIKPEAQDMEYPVLLSEHPAPNIRAYPQEAVVAEKLHALVVLGGTNSRLKDFYDLYVMASRFDFTGAVLCESVAATFKGRQTALPETLPLGLTAQFFADEVRVGRWQAYLREGDLPAAPQDFGQVGERLRAFLGPVVDALAAGEEHERHWNAGGGWL
jgi:predicted nucleotidyltransferase component of viral defense system